MSMLLKIWRVLYISFSDNSSDINLNLTEGILQSIPMMRKRWRELICTSNVTRGREVTWITYTTSSFAQLLSMELTLEIDGAIFHVPNANASSNVDSQL
ncbi:hypothetical protein YC2023_036889 [Brassica napus]